MRQPNSSRALAINRATRDKKSSGIPKADSIADRTLKDRTKTGNPSKSITSNKGRKRAEPRSGLEDHTNPKRLKTISVKNVRPTQILDVFVCGDGDTGELGLGSEKRDGRAPKNVRAPRLNSLVGSDTVGVVQVAVGGIHCASLSHDSKILTWGVNDDGALGRETDWAPDSDAEDEDEYDLNPLESTPTEVSLEALGGQALEVVQIVATDCATFALTSDGSIYGWGTFRGNEGRIGFSPERSAKNDQIQATPVRISKLKDIVKLASGSHHVLALDRKGSIFAWGSGQQCQLGRRNYTRRAQQLSSNVYMCLTPEPVFFSQRKRITDISCGAFHSFAVDKDSKVYAWGLNNFGQTGIQAGAGEDGAVVQEPTMVQSLEQYDIREVQGGSHHSIAVTEEGEVLVWGRCDDSQAGIELDSQPKDNVLRDSNGRPRILLEPTKIPASTVAAGADNSMAVSRDGRVFSWGFSANYRTGLMTEETVTRPTPIENKALKDKKLTFVGCGGLFSVFAGPARAT